MKPSTNSPKTPLRGMPVPGLKTKLRSTKSQLRSFHNTNSRELRKLHSTLNIAREMLESPNLEGSPISLTRTTQPLTSQGTKLPTCLSDCTSAQFQLARDTLLDRAEVVDGLTEDINKKSIELAHTLPESSRFTKKDLKDALIGASLSVAVVSITLAAASPLPIWAQGLAAASGLVIGVAAVLFKKGFSRTKKVTKVKEEISRVKEKLGQTMAKYSSDLEGLMMRLSYLIPQEEAEQASRAQKLASELLDLEKVA